jgi:hypothetical protein
LAIVREKLDGVADAVETMLKHLNYYKAARMPEQARQWATALALIRGPREAIRFLLA